MGEIFRSPIIGLACLIAAVACSHQWAKGTFSEGGWREDLRVWLGLAGTAVFMFSAISILTGQWS